MSLEVFYRAYREALEWTEAEEIGDADDFDASVEEQSRADCADFYAAHGDKWDDDEQAGHDFWLTRNRHGAGFWDRAPEVYGAHADSLTDAAHVYGEVCVYVGDDGRIYLA